MRSWYSPVVTVLTEHEAHAVQMSGMGHRNLKRRRDFLHPSIVLRVGGVTIDSVTQANVTRLPDSRFLSVLLVTKVTVTGNRTRVSGKVTEVLSSAVRNTLPHLSGHGRHYRELTRADLKNGKKLASFLKKGFSIP